MYSKENDTAKPPSHHIPQHSIDAYCFRFGKRKRKNHIENRLNGQHCRSWHPLRHLLPADLSLPAKMDSQPLPQKANTTIKTISSPFVLTGTLWIQLRTIASNICHSVRGHIRALTDRLVWYTGVYLGITVMTFKRPHQYRHEGSPP